MHYYSTLEGGMVITASDIYCLDDVLEQQKVIFELATENGFKRAEAYLPMRIFPIVQGFTEDEMFEIEEILLTNSLGIWDLARTSGFLDYKKCTNKSRNKVMLKDIILILRILMPLIFIMTFAALLKKFGNGVILPVLIVPGLIIMLNREGRFDSLKKAFKKYKS